MAHHICAKSLTICGTLNFTLHIYPNSSTNSTKIIGKTHKIRPKNTLFENISGKNIKTTKAKLKYAKIPIKVGTGHLTHFRSAPGLSNTFHFLNTNRPIAKTNVINKNESIYFNVILSETKNLKIIHYEYSNKKSFQDILNTTQKTQS